MRFRFTVALFVSLKLAALAVEADRQKPFRIGVEQSPPYNYWKPDGSPGGLAVDVIAEAARRRGIALEWVAVSEGPETSLSEGRVDLWPMLADTPERRAKLHITQPWVRTTMWLVSSPSSGIQSWRDTAGRTVAHTARRMATRVAHRFLPNASYVPVQNVDEILALVCAGKVDAGMVPASVADMPVNRKFPGCEDAPPRVSPVPDATLWFGVGASRRRPDAVAAADKLRREIGSMAMDGALNSIYFRSSFYPVDATTVIHELLESERRSGWLIGAMALLGLALVLAAWQAAQARRARRAAEKASAAKSEFLARMSHEIRTPMHAVIGLTSLLLESPLNSRQKEYAATTHESAQSLLRIIDDILDFSKIEAGKLDIERAPFDLHALAESVLDSFGLQAAEKPLLLQLHYASTAPRHLVGDAGRIRQVLSNLLANAIKFTPQGRILVSVQTLEQGPSRPFLRITVEDTGIGIAPERLGAIFEPFVQADTSTTRRFGGTGLGLSIARQLVELMGGEIGAASEPGNGSSFWFTIPASSCAEPAAPDSAVCLQPQSLDAESAARALVVEDNVVNQKVIVRMLEKLGYTVDVASDGGCAVRMTDASRYDLVLMDCHMPGIGGCEAAAEIRRREPAGRRVRIVAVTADVTGESRRRCHEAGMDEFLSKPISLEELRQIIGGARAEWSA